MLQEQSTLEGNKQVSYTIEQVDYYPIHMHHYLEIVYVIKGSIRLKYSYFDYNLPEKCMHIINSTDLHSYYNNGEDNLVLFLHLDMDDYRRRNPYEGRIIFVSGHYCNQSVDDTQVLTALTSLVRELAASNPLSTENTPAAHALADEFITQLIHNYQFFFIDNRQFKSNKKFKGDDAKIFMLRRIIKYIYDNYMYRIKLSDIAEAEHISIWHLSHLFKQAVGYSFQDFVSFARVEFSERLLLDTTRSISDISYECGFSSPRYYIENFTNWFGMNPSEYRLKYKDQTISTQSKRSRALQGKEAAAAMEFMISEFGEIENAKIDPCSQTVLSISLLDAGTMPAKDMPCIFSQSIFNGSRKETADDNLYDSGYMAATIIHFVLKNDLENLPALSLQDYPADAYFYGSNGLLTAHGWKKASYFAYWFLLQLGSEELSRSKHHLLTRSKKGLQLLLYNYNDDFPDTGDLTPLELIINEIDSDYMITRYTINHFTKLPYRLWLDMGEPEKLNSEAMELFKNIILPDFDCVRPNRKQPAISTSLVPFEVQLWLLEKG